jgi:DNA ligase 1
MRIEYHGCQRAHEYKAWPEEVESLWIDPKFDGYRLSALIDDKQNVKFYCREMKPVPWGATNLQHLAKELLRLKFKSCLVDGEIRGRTWGETALVKTTGMTDENRQTILDHVKFHVFDHVDYTQLETGPVPGKRGEHLMDPRSQLERRQFLAKRLEGRRAYIQPVLPNTVKNQRELESIYRIYVKEGHEGGMVKRLESPYIFDKCDAWMKLKPVKTEELRVVRAIEGQGKYVGMLGALLCVNVKGQEISVGGGYSDAQRKIFWAIRKKLSGRILECEMQDSDVAKARGPQFVKWRPDRDRL